MAENDVGHRLKLLERVATGGQSEIYRGQILGERGTFRQVAVKRLRAELTNVPNAVDLFVHEARLALQVDHPNLTRAIELCRDDGGYLLVCEWIQGKSLASLRAHGGFAPWPAAVHVGQSVCHGLAHLHALTGPDGEPLRAVHRDVTPTNVLVCADGQVKLGDYGVASYTSGEQLDAAGTPGYAAPEQLVGGELTAATDVYGLASTLRDVAGEVPDALAAVLARATAEDPEGRFATAEDFAAALEEVAATGTDTTGKEAVRLWYDRGAAAPEPSTPLQLDNAVRSLLGDALTAPGVGSASPPANPRWRRKRWLFMAAAFATIIGIGVHYASGPGRALPAPQKDSLAAGADEPPRAAGPADLDPTPTTTRGPADAPVDAQPTADPRPPSPKRAALATESPEMTRAPQSAVPFGLVNLNAVPWANVHMDGRLVGSTPLRAIKLAGGTHTVRLSHPPERLERTYVIDVTAGTQQALFDFDLRRGTQQKRLE